MRFQTGVLLGVLCLVCTGFDYRFSCTSIFISSTSQKAWNAYIDSPRKLRCDIVFQGHMLGAFSLLLLCQCINPQTQLSTKIKRMVMTQFKGWGFFSFNFLHLKARDRTEATRIAAKTHVHVGRFRLKTLWGAKILNMSSRKVSSGLLRSSANGNKKVKEECWIIKCGLFF